MLVAYETHAKPCIRKDMRVLAYMRVYHHVHEQLTDPSLIMTTYRIRTNIGGSNIWRFVENMHLTRF